MKCNLKILHKIQGRAELFLSRALRTTATKALYTIFDLQPLDDRNNCDIIFSDILMIFFLDEINPKILKLIFPKILYMIYMIFI